MAEFILFSYLCGMNENNHWSENIIIADADYIDKVAFELSVNFERMIGRRIPKADLARWLDCIALDGGLREGENEVQVVLIHDKGDKAFENFAPSDYAGELNGKAFKDHLGEFIITTLEVEDIVTRTQFINAYSRRCVCSRECEAHHDCARWRRRSDLRPAARRTVARQRRHQTDHNVCHATYDGR